MAKLVTVKMIVSAEDDVNVNDMVDYIMQTSDIAVDAFEENFGKEFSVIGSSYEVMELTDETEH